MRHKTFFKEPIPRDKKYLAFIRQQPCLIYQCSADATASHMTTGGRGIKGSDYHALPLCHHHHNIEYHAGVETFYKKYPYIDKWKEIANYNGKYLVELKEGARKI